MIDREQQSSLSITSRPMGRSDLSVCQRKKARLDHWLMCLLEARRQAQHQTAIRKIGSPDLDLQQITIVAGPLGRPVPFVGRKEVMQPRRSGKSCELT